MKASPWRVAILATALALSTASLAQKKPLDHSVYDGWKSISGTILSRDGSHAAWTINPQEGDGVSELFQFSDKRKTSYPRLTGLRFTRDGKFLIATQSPKFADTRAAARAAAPGGATGAAPAGGRAGGGGPRPGGAAGAAPAPPTPRSGLAIIPLDSGEAEIIESVTSWSQPAKNPRWLLYRPATASDRPAGTGGSALPEGTPPSRDEEPITSWSIEEDQQGAPAAQPAAEENKEATKKKASHQPGVLHILRRLGSDFTLKLKDAAGFTFSEDGRFLLVSLSTKDGAGDGLKLYDLTKDEPAATEIAAGLGRYVSLALSEDGSQAAFVTDRDDYSAQRPTPSLYTWSKGKGLQKVSLNGVQDGLEVSDGGAVRFTGSGKRLLFAVRPKPVDLPPLPPEADRINLDVWHWKDSATQLSQIRRGAADRLRSFTCRLDLATGKVIQIESEDRRSVSIPDEGDADFGLHINSEPYARRSTWGDVGTDVSIVDLRTGTSRLIFEDLKGSISSSPKGRWFVGWDSQAKEVFSVHPATGKKTVLSRGLPPLFNELHDLPGYLSAYGVAGWMEGEDRVLVLDRYDIWSVDPEGVAKPVNLTLGLGRALETEIRILRTNPEQTHFKAGDDVFFSMASQRTKEVSIGRGDLSGRARPKELIGGPQVVTLTAKAEEADRVVFTQQRFDVFPDLWTSNASFSSPERLTEANPQMKEYLWGTSELITYTSNDGVPLEGMLIKPGGFDPSKQYPMIVYFYERDSQNLHRFRSPAPSASTINPSMFASNGYVVLITDIPYKEGYPGESAVSAILPATQKVLEMGFVDPKRVGIQGQSWGGYQVAYLVTETNMFAAACAGAPVSNMFSAYSGIRYGTGVLRQMQYEAGQSRIGLNMWEAPMRYYENSPVFFADKVRTPLLIMSNDNDGAVPWTEGIQFFAALRRLDRPVWLLSYNGEDHNLVQRKNRKDFTIRLHQFFDHFLKGAPAPVWLADGIPASEKGRNLGLQLKGEEPKKAPQP